LGEIVVEICAILMTIFQHRYLIGIGGRWGILERDPLEAFFYFFILYKEIVNIVTPSLAVYFAGQYGS
jgi:hypothetical protein